MSKQKELTPEQSKALAAKIATQALNGTTAHLVDEKKNKNTDEEILASYEDILTGIAEGGTYESMIKPMADLADKKEILDELGLDKEEFSKESMDQAVDAAKNLDSALAGNESGLTANDLISISGKINRINLQIQIIEKQEQGIELDEKDPTYKHLFVKSEDGTLAKDIFIVDKLKSSIKEMEASLYMVDLIEGIKKPSVYVDKSRFNATKTKLMKKIYADKLEGLSPYDLAHFPHLLDFDEILEALNRVNSSDETKVYNEIFVYALMKYISQNYTTKKTYIDLVTDNIVYLKRYPELDQNALVIDSLEKVYGKLFPEALN